MAESTTDAVPGQIWLELAELRRQRGDTAGARAALDAAEALLGRGATLHARGVLALTSGAPDEAEAVFAAQAEAAESAARRAQALANAGAAALEGGRPQVALEWFERAGTLAGGGDRSLDLNAGRAWAGVGDSARARAAFRAAREAEDRRVRGLAALFDGELAVAEGSPDAAERLEEALQSGLSAGEAARAWVGLAELAARRDDTPAAADALGRALGGLPAEPDPFPRIGVLTSLGGHRYRLRDVVGARRVLDEAARLAMGRSLPARMQARLDTNRGLVLLAQGELDAAEALLSAACAVYAELGDRHAQALQLRALVDLHRYRGDLPAAIGLQATLAELEPALDTPLPEGGMLYSAVEDRSLSVSVSALRQAGPAHGTGPVLLLVPPAWGASGPLFPRGAVSVASFLATHGVPAQVVPIADVVDSHDDADTAARRVAAVVEQAIRAFRPRAIGISVTFSYLYPQGRQLAALARALAPDTPIVMGGPHVTYLDRETLAETPSLDVVVRGEGEWTALELFRALAAKGDLADVAGITWRAPDGQIHRNKGRKLGDVRALPPVDFGLLPATFAHRMDVSALTSRGCAFRCKFCHEFRYWGGVVRDFEVSRIVGEMERLARFGNHLQGIDDSMLDMTTPLFLELVDALGRSDHVTPNFGLLTRLDTVTAQGARAMAAAGLRWVSMGAESGSQVVLDAMNKGLAVGQTTTSLRLVREAGLEAATFFIVGHPGDTVAESKVTLDFVDALWRDDLVSWIDVSTFSPYPGTPFYSMAERYGVRILSRDWSRWRRTNRPVAELETYPAAAIYQTYLEMLAVQARYRDAEGLLPPGPQATGQ